jgi:hypothetical protein
MISIGVDLGQRRDPSAIAVIEKVEWIAGQFHTTPQIMGGRPHYGGYDLRQGDMVVRHLERVPLATPYSQVVKRVAEMTRHPSLGNVRGKLIVDATGVGAPVVEMLRDPFITNAQRPGCEMTPVVTTDGSAARRDGNGWEMVPKVDLLSAMQASLENGQLRIARQMRETERLVKEMVGLGGSEQDDLAVALAVWGAKTGITYGFRSEFLPVY